MQDLRNIPSEFKKWILIPLLRNTSTKTISKLNITRFKKTNYNNTRSIEWNIEILLTDAKFGRKERGPQESLFSLRLILEHTFDFVGIKKAE